MANRYDFLIVGARCAGASTALLLARRGARVLVIDRQEKGSDTLSTHALMRTGVVLLNNWGVLPAIHAAGTPKIRTTTFVYGDETVALDIEPGDGIDALAAPRRTVLDPLLAEAAEAAGADIRYGTTLEHLIVDAEGRVIGARLLGPDGRRRLVTAGTVIGADGRRSTVADQAGAEFEQVSAHATATLFGYFAGLPNTGSRWAFGDRNASGTIPTTGGLTCVFAGVRPKDFKATFAGDPLEALRRAVARSDPETAERLGGASLEGKLRRYPGAPGFLRRCHGAGWALVGDAGYFKDPCTAHGITDALRDAQLLSGALARGDLEDYARTRLCLSRDLFETTDAIAALDWDMDQVKALHRRLSRAQKAEHHHISDTAARLVA